jgi:2-methylcitrate dehydratase PrpD
MALTGGRKAPRNAQEAGVSLHHWAAAALVRRAAGLAEAAEDCVHDPAVAALRARVAAVVDPAMADDATDAVVTLEDGGRLARHVAHCRGSRDNPMSDDDLAAKFRGLAETALGEAAAAAVLGECWKLDGIGDVGTWLRRSLAGA